MLRAKFKKNKKEKVKIVKKPVSVLEPQRWCRGYSTMDGQPCEAFFNVTNWH